LSIPHKVEFLYFWLKHIFLPFQPQGGFWLGATDNLKEGSWIWQSSGKPMTYSKWAAGEPNNCCGGENCLQMNAFSGGAWNDAVCTNLVSVLCEFTYSC
jgi:hypothetical protein